MPEVEEENPWAGSLRHVDDHRKGKARKEEKEDTYGNAPWMGTLRYSTYRDIYIFLDKIKVNYKYFPGTSCTITRYTRNYRSEPVTKARGEASRI